ncbi:hypothetical protein MMC20_001217 [Loxospora ochrophaea]|nr:hypothetical protein [Loxospora ochrophaea]
MSNYISSFLIDPVIRQARQLSRSSTNPDSLIREPALEQHGDHASTHKRYLDSLRETSAIEADLLCCSPTTLPSDQAQRPSATSEAEDTRHDFDHYAESALDQQDAHEILDDDALDDEQLDRAELSGCARVNGETSDDPPYGVPNHPRSHNTSLSSSNISSLEYDTTPMGDSMRSRQSSIQNGSNESQIGRVADGLLPADDGMGRLRKRIIKIQQMEKSNEDKARLMHDLMTRQYASSQSSLHLPYNRPISPLSQDRPVSPTSGYSIKDILQAVSPTASWPSRAEAENKYNLSIEDLKPTYHVETTPHAPPSTEVLPEQNTAKEHGDVGRRLGCPHYKRNVKLQCSACARWYTCRFCHDEIEDHSLNRRETKNMLCMLCGCAQPAAGECMDCGERAAWYYCNICKLWDDDAEKNIYHCNDCGICRIGQGLGKDFYHCKARSYGVHLGSDMLIGVF